MHWPKYSSNQGTVVYDAYFAFATPWKSRIECASTTILKHHWLKLVHEGLIESEQHPDSDHGQLNKPLSQFEGFNFSAGVECPTADRLFVCWRVS